MWWVKRRGYPWFVEQLTWLKIQREWKHAHWGSMMKYRPHTGSQGGGRGDLLEKVGQQDFIPSDLW